MHESFKLFSLQLNRSQFASTLTLALFWSAIGGVVYILIWLAGNIYIDIRNKVVEEVYYVNKPANWQRKRDRFAMALRIMFRASVILVLLFFVAAFTQAILPFAVGVFEVFTNNLTDPAKWLNGLAGLLALVVSAHVFAILFRLLLVRDRVFDGFN